MGDIVTFYSYKGGVGRTMALANTAVLLARWGHAVLIIDWDLEAPGLEFYFKDFIDPHSAMQQAGIIELLRQPAETEAPPTPGATSCYPSRLTASNRPSTFSLPGCATMATSGGYAS